jgi:hypothetical protein
MMDWIERRHDMKAWYLMTTLLLIGVTGCVVVDLGGDHEDEHEIPLVDVPAEALQAARAAVDGITLEEAEVEEEDGQTVYVLEGEANGLEYEIEVTADGKVLEVEQDDEDDDDDDDDDHDDDHDDDG